MKILAFLVIMMAFVFIFGYDDAYALQQVAGKLEANISKGETATLQWALISDNPDKVTRVELRAEGPGSEFISLPKFADLPPQQVYNVVITVNIPSDYSGNAVFNPSVYATEKGEQGGPTVINIQMLKVLTINVLDAQKPQAQPSASTEMTTKEQPAGLEAKPEQAAKTPVCGEGTVLKDGQCVPAKTPTASAPSSGGGGCLVATAAYGSELSTQVQLLREVRDNVLFSTGSGTAFMAGFNDFYYSFSPAVADLERQNPLFKEIVRTAITPMLSTLSILNYVDIDSEQEMLGYGIGIILLNTGIYFVVPALVVIKLKSRIRSH